MYRKTKQEMEESSFYDEVKDKVFICHQNIDCGEGIFEKGSSVFIGLTAYKVNELYDPTQWKDPQCRVSTDYTDCFSDKVRTKIDKYNFSEYFTENKEATAVYFHMLEAKKESDRVRYKNNNIKNRLTVILIYAFLASIASLFLSESVIEGLFHRGDTTVCKMFFIGSMGFGIIFLISIISFFAIRKMLNKKENAVMTGILSIKEELYDVCKNTEYSSMGTEYSTARRILERLARTNAAKGV